MKSPEQYQQTIAQCVSLSFAEMTRDLELRLGVVLSRSLPKDVVVNMAVEISKTVTEEMMVHFFSSGKLEDTLRRLL